MTAKKNDRWLRHKLGEGEFVFLSNLLKTEEEAEKKQLRPNELLKHTMKTWGN